MQSESRKRLNGKVLFVIVVITCSFDCVLQK